MEDSRETCVKSRRINHFWALESAHRVSPKAFCENQSLHIETVLHQQLCVQFCGENESGPLLDRRQKIRHQKCPDPNIFGDFHGRGSTRPFSFRYLHEHVFNEEEVLARLDQALKEAPALNVGQKSISSYIFTRPFHHPSGAAHLDPCLAVVHHLQSNSRP